MKSPASASVRQRIIDTAARLFYQQGYPLTGINQLIAEAGVAKASLYQHFRTKDEILLAYLQQASQQWLHQMNEAAATAPTPREQVLAVFDMMQRFLPAVNFRGCDFQNALVQLPPDEAEVRAFIQEHKGRVHGVFVRLLGAGELAEELYLLFEGAVITSQIRGDLTAAVAARRLAERLLV